MYNSHLWGKVRECARVAAYVQWINLATTGKHACVLGVHAVRVNVGFIALRHFSLYRCPHDGKLYRNIFDCSSQMTFRLATCHPLLHTFVAIL